MVKFSCFQTRIHSYKNKKTIRQSAESMKKTLEDPSRGQDRMKSSFSEANHEPCVKEEGNTLIDDTDNVVDSSPTERDCKSEELESKYNTDSDIVVHKNALIKKSQSLGSGLNWKQRPSGSDGSEDEIEHAFSYDGSADRSGKVTSDGTNDHGINPSVQLQEPMPSDSVRATCNFTKNGSMFSIGDQQQSEKEITIKNDIDLSGSVDCTPRTPPGIVKSSSLPSMSSPHRISTTLLPCSRSAEDLKALNSWKYGHHEMRRKMQNEEIYDSISNNEKNKDEAPADGTCETYNYVESAKDWIVPASDGVNMEKGESSYHHWNEMPTENFRLNRIQAWVNELQQSDPLQDSEEVVPCDDHLLPEGDIVLGEPTVSKLEVKVNPGAEAAKRYISSLNASATAAQLTNLGLVVIPFLSAFVSLKALNLSGNAIVRITAGALPRGLHILNLSKNSISTIEGLRDLTRLRVLDLSYNRILRIGHGLAGCSSIKELYLAGNKISEVEGLHRLLKLNVLDLRFNKISTTKCLGQLAANYNCLQALSLEGNPSQKNVGDEQLKKYIQNLLPRLTYYNRQSIKVGTMKDTPSDRSSRLGINGHQVDRGLKVEVKTMRKGTHGIVAQKVSSSSIHGRKSQGVVSSKLPRSRHGRLPPVGVKATTQGNQFANFSSKVLSFKDDLSMRRSRSEGTLGML